MNVFCGLMLMCSIITPQKGTKISANNLMPIMYQIETKEELCFMDKCCH